jgi:hypothetical protein
MLWGRHLGTSDCSHQGRITLINWLFFFLPVCFILPVALPPRYLVLLYQLKVCNFKTTLSERGSKATKRACMARGETLMEAWMGTLDEVDFLSPYISCEAYIFSMKREEVSEGIVFCCCKGQKQRH